MATLTMTIGENNDSTTVFLQFTGSGPEYTCTFNTPIHPKVDVGDIFTDNDGDGEEYLCMSISDDRKTVVIRDKIGEPGGEPKLGATFETSRAFSSFTLAEDGIASWAASGDVLIWECHSEGTMPLMEAPVTFDDTTLGTGGTLKLTVADGEWHRGTAGSGFMWQANAAGNGITFATADVACPTQIIERLEILGITTSTSTTIGIYIFRDGVSTQQATVRECIVHDFVSDGGGSPGVYGIYVASTATNGARVENCLAYNFTLSGGSVGGAAGFRTSTTNAEFDNCDSYNCKFGFWKTGGGTDNVAKNCAGLGTSDDFRGTWHANSTNNADSDGTAPGANAQSNLTATEEFADVAAEDFNIRPTSALRRAGVDLGLTTDIRGKRLVKTPNIGAYGTQFGGQYLPALDCRP